MEETEENSNTSYSHNSNRRSKTVSQKGWEKRLPNDVRHTLIRKSLMAKQDSLLSSYFDSDTEEHSSLLKIRPTKYVLANPRESRGSLSFALLSDTSNTTNNSLEDKENEIRKQTMRMKLRETKARLTLHEPNMSSISESGYKKGKQSINDFKLDTHNSEDFESDLSIEPAKKMKIRFSRISIPSELFSSPESTNIDQSQNMTDDRNELEHISIESSTANIRKSDLENTLSDSKIIKNVDKLEGEIFESQNSKSSPLVFLSSKNLSDVNTSLNRSSGRNTSLKRNNRTLHSSSNDCKSDLRLSDLENSTMSETSFTQESKKLKVIVKPFSMPSELFDSNLSNTTRESSRFSSQINHSQNQNLETSTAGNNDSISLGSIRDCGVMTQSIHESLTNFEYQYENTSQLSNQALPSNLSVKLGKIENSFQSKSMDHVKDTNDPISKHLRNSKIQDHNDSEISNESFKSNSSKKSASSQLSNQSLRNNLSVKLDKSKNSFHSKSMDYVKDPNDSVSKNLRSSQNQDHNDSKISNQSFKSMSSKKSDSSQLSNQSLRKNSSIKSDKTENSFQSKSMDHVKDTNDPVSKNLSSQNQDRNNSKISNQSFKSNSSKKSANNTNLDHFENMNGSLSNLGNFEKQDEDHSLNMLTYTINQGNISQTSSKRNSSKKNKNMVDYSQASSNETMNYKRFSKNRTHTNTSNQNEEDNVNENNDQSTMVVNETIPTNDQELDNYEIENGKEFSENDDSKLENESNFENQCENISQLSNQSLRNNSSVKLNKTKNSFQSKSMDHAKDVNDSVSKNLRSSRNQDHNDSKLSNVSFKSNSSKQSASSQLSNQSLRKNSSIKLNKTENSFQSKNMDHSNVSVSKNLRSSQNQVHNDSKISNQSFKSNSSKKSANNTNLDHIENMNESSSTLGTFENQNEDHSLKMLTHTINQDNTSQTSSKRNSSRKNKNMIDFSQACSNETGLPSLSSSSRLNRTYLKENHENNSSLLNQMSMHYKRFSKNITHTITSNQIEEEFVNENNDQSAMVVKEKTSKNDQEKDFNEIENGVESSEDEDSEFESLSSFENQCENSSQLSNQSLRNNSSVKLNKTENSFQSKSMDHAKDGNDSVSKNLRSSKNQDHNDSKISNVSFKSNSSKKSANNTNFDYNENMNESSSTLGTFENQNEDHSLNMLTYTINQDNTSQTSSKRNSSKKNKNMIDILQASSNETKHFKRFSKNRTHTNTSNQNEEDNVNENNDQSTMVANETMPTNDQEIENNEIENGEEIFEDEDYISEDNRTKSDSDSEDDFNYKQDDSSTSEDEISSIERNSAVGTHNSMNSEKHSKFSFSKPSTSVNGANTSKLFGNVTFVFPGDTPQSTIIKGQSNGITEQFTPIRKTNSTTVQNHRTVQSNTSKSIGKNLFETAVKSFRVQEPSINGRAQMDLNMLGTDRASVRSNLSSFSRLSEKLRKPNAQSTFLVSRTPQKKSHSNDIHKFLQQINKNNIRRNYSPKRHFSQKNNELNPCQPMLVHFEPAVTKVIKSGRAKTQIKKNEILIDGVPYKKPRLKKLPYYTTRIEKCIIEKMDLVDSKDTHAKLHGFLSYISQCVNCIMIKKDYQAKLIDALMYKLAKYKIINSRNQFFSFVIKHFPDKAVWKIVPTLKPTCDNMPEFDPDTLDDPIIQEQVEES